MNNCSRLNCWHILHVIV